MIDAGYFKALFPELSAESDARITIMIGIATLSVSPSAWGTLADPATAYLTAHMLALAKRGVGGASGPVTSSKVGELSRGYADLTALLKSELAATVYGAEYLRMRRQILVTPMVTGGATGPYVHGYYPGDPWPL